MCVVCVFLKYIFPCMIHYHGVILHALFTDYILFLSILYTSNILLEYYMLHILVTILTLTLRVVYYFSLV